jgi:hypothetical protein
MDWQNVFCEVEDRFVPELRLDAYERALYHYLLRHTRLEAFDTRNWPRS